MRTRLARRHRNFHAEQDGHDSDEKEESSVIREADALQCLACGLVLRGPGAEMVLLGRSATKRAATDSDSEAVAGSSETAATNDLILSVAASVGS